MPEAVEELHLLLAVAAHLAVLGEVADELVDACPQLVCEMRRRDLVSLGAAALIGIFLNQLTFVYAVKLTTATTVALLFGTLPVMAGLFALVLGIDRVGTRFWLAGVLAAFGAALVAVGSSGAVSGHVWGDLLALAATATWAWYSVAAAPLLRGYSPLRVSSLAFVIGSIPLFIAGAPQLASQDYR